MTSSDLVPVLEGNIAKRTLQFFWLADCSGSMKGKKISTLNQAVREALPEIKEAVSAHPEVQIEMRAIAFSNEAAWHVGPEPVALEDFVWPDLEAGGITGTAQAIELLSEELSVDKMNRRGYPPVCILLSDGYCTDDESRFESAIQTLNEMPWGRKAVRLAIGIGQEHQYNEQELLKFVSHEEIGVLKADSPEKLTSYIQWASVAASVGASVGKSRMSKDDEHNVALPPPPSEVTLVEDADEDDVF
ncbi:uncharacterized protein YegL [Salsuginibacillus halophilus]|uniref:Uncharacterized protein YegL n=1 Tax=Salsuginibacillus halophilus TaxID=517424 RepID=A0A2P8HBI5_9BACI|nr:VWA domain-containing protein [Salsuginibacillus halophilus]PSL43583.1 uncharacterized protein YegL [Salsuginibacillus halophilus]